MTNTLALNSVFIILIQAIVDVKTEGKVTSHDAARDGKKGTREQEI